MSGSISNALTSPSTGGGVHGHHHHRAQPVEDGAATQTSAVSPSSSTAASPSQSAPATPPAGAFQSFSDELKQILLSVQGGGQAQTITANDPATASNPQAAGDVTNGAGSNPIGKVAERLQHLLQTTGAAPATPDVQSVLDTLQQTLQRSLQSYQTSSAAAGSSTTV